MKASLFTPYLDTLGGGERYMLSIARVLLEEGWQVTIENKDHGLIKRAEERFGFSLNGLTSSPSINRGDGTDLCVWLSDGSIPVMRSRKNIIHFQRPFWDVDGKSLIERMKFFRIHKVIVNSLFTKKYIDNAYPVKSVVLYPPVDVSQFRPLKKEPLISYIGRFSQLEQSKRQDVVLSAFLKFYKFEPQSWKLLLAGASDVGRTESVDILKEHAKKAPVSVLENPDFTTIQKALGHSVFFWSASGYGVDAEKEPNRLEHFGMTVVEAMASGAIPLIYGVGGGVEIIRDGINGFLWQKPEEMIFYTKKLIQDPDRIQEISKAAVVDAQKFSYEKFKANFLSLI